MTLPVDRGPVAAPAVPSVLPTGRRALQRQCACGKHAPGGGDCEECRKKREAMQRRAVTRSEGLDAGDGGTVAPPALGPGRALESGLADRFRPGLGSLIDRVRVHDDERGARYAERVGAVAVTAGRDIAFARGAFRPSTDAGRGLLAHELAHVHQQHGPDGPPAGYLSKPGDRWERAADRFAATATLPGGATTALSPTAPPRILQAQGGTFGGFWSKVGRSLLNVVTFGLVDLGYSETTLLAYLDVLAAGTIENDFDSDNKARDVVRKRATLGPFTTDVKRLLIEEMLAGATLGDDEDAIIALLRDTPRPERMGIVRTIGRDRLWGNFSFGNRRTIEGLTLEVSDFQNAETTNRLSGLSASDLRDYRAASDDPAVQAEIDKLLTLAKITTPVLERTRLQDLSATTGGGLAVDFHGYRVTILPDRVNPALGDHAHTSLGMSAPTPGGTVDSSGTVVSVDPTPRIPVTIQTEYPSGTAAAGASGYGRGTTLPDKASGNTSLRFHESRHGLDFFDFLASNPPPVFGGHAGMSRTEFDRAIADYRHSVDDLGKRAAEFSVRNSDCPGTPIPPAGIPAGISATICTEATP